MSSLKSRRRFRHWKHWLPLVIWFLLVMVIIALLLRGGW